MARGLRTKTSGFLSRKHPDGPFVAFDEYRKMPPMVAKYRGRLSERARTKMLERQRDAVDLLERERRTRWADAGASHEFQEHILPMLPSTETQRSVLVALADPYEHADFVNTSIWYRKAPLLTQSEALAWIDRFRHLYEVNFHGFQGLMPPPDKDPSIRGDRSELSDLLYYRNVPHPGGASNILTAALYLSRRVDGCSFSTLDDLLRAIDRDRAENRYQRDDDGPHARALVIRAGEWVAQCIEAGEMADLTCADLGLDTSTADTHTRHQMEIIRDYTWEAMLEEPTRARAYLKQLGLKESGLGPLRTLLAGEETESLVMALAVGMKRALVANYGTALATPAQSAQLQSWLMSMPDNSDKPVHWFFQSDHMRSTALGLAIDADLRGIRTAKAGTTTAATPSVPPVAPTGKRKSVRSIRDAMTRR